MPFLPDWAPNAHPLVLHFPIALLFAGGLFDLIGLLARDRGGWRRGADWLYALGALATVATFFTGRAAADSVFLPTQANAVLTEHADLGQWTMFFFGGYAVVRTALTFTSFATKALPRVVFFVLGAAGLGLITVTATHGAELVYRYGVGVEAVETRPSLPQSSMDLGESGFAKTTAGWVWLPARAGAWKADVDWIEGSSDALRSSLVDGGSRGDVLEFEVTEPTLFALPGTLNRVQIDLALDVSAFDGAVYVVHHLQDDGSYGFTSFGNDLVRLGRTENSDLLVQATEAFDGSDWRELRIVADDTHFRSYVDTELAIHGHSTAFAPGRIGLRLNGSGVVRLAGMQAVDLAVSGEETPESMMPTEGGENDAPMEMDHAEDGEHVVDGSKEVEKN